MADGAERQRVLGIVLQAKDRFTPGVTAARAALRLLGASVRVTFGALRGAARLVTSAFDALLGPLGSLKFLLAGLGIGALIRSFHSLAHEMHDTFSEAQQLGTSVETLQELKHAAAIFDVQVEQLARNLVRLTAEIGDARRGGQKTGETFKRLGLSVEELTKLDPTDQLIAVVDALRLVENQTERVTLATDLFSKRNLSVLGLLVAHEGGLKAMREEAHRLGIVIDHETIEIFDEWMDEWVRLKAAIKGVRLVMAIEFLPLLTQAADAIKEFFITRRDDIRKWAKIAAEAITFAAQTLKAFVALLRDLVTRDRAAVLGEVLQQVADLGLDLAREIAIAAARIIFAALRAIVRPLINFIGLIGEQAGLRFAATFRAELATLSVLPLEIMKGMADAMRSVLGATAAAVLAQTPQLNFLLPFMTLTDEQINAAKANIRATVSGLSAAAETAIKSGEQILGEAVINLIDVLGEEVRAGSTAITDALDGMHEALTEFATDLSTVTDPAVQAFLARFTELHAAFDEARASILAATEAVRVLGEHEVAAALGPFEVTEKQLEALAKLEEDTAALRARGRERAAIETQIAFDREVREREESLEEIRGHEVAFENWLLARRQQLADDLAEINGTFLQGVASAFETWADEIGNDFARGVRGFQDVINSISSGFGSAIDSMISGTKDAGEAWKEFGATVLKVLGEIIAQELAIAAVRFIFGSFSPFKRGGIVEGGLVPAHAMQAGGIVDRPTMALIGEGRQKEAVIPLPDGRHVEAIVTDPAGAVPSEVNVTFEIQAVDTNGFQRLLTREQPLIENMIRRAMAQRRNFRETVRRVAN